MHEVLFVIVWKQGYECIIESFFTIYFQFFNNILHASAQLEKEQDIICDTQVIPQ